MAVMPVVLMAMMLFSLMFVNSAPQCVGKDGSATIAVRKHGWLAHWPNPNYNHKLSGVVAWVVAVLRNGAAASGSAISVESADIVFTMT